MAEKSSRVIVNGLLTVIKVEHLSSNFIRIYFSCDKSLQINPLWVGPHLKLIFADPITKAITFPGFDEKGKLLLTENVRKLARTYSIRKYDEVTNQLVIDFAIHAKGIAILWAQSAKESDQIGLFGMGSKTVFENSYLVLIGDIAAVPAICYSLENLPDNQKASAFIEVKHQSDVMPLPNNDNVEINWLIANSLQPNQLIDSVIAANLPTHDDLLFWGGMESSLAQQLRHAIKDKYSDLNADAVQIISYWREGFAEGEFRHRE
ncbi:siderophore-interacting protein [Gilliamella sp. wkB112]|uniref:siderophore-interacting protein n=1 Tax=Gilliamella sp. wkB112 TaxID=3120257 RepID=UPI00080E7B6C|nr:siderophore-interacting protein [Gilliamella apicola]OCG01094.1 hypothetical protein A9G12_00610 [Gilliamella apicola]